MTKPLAHVEMMLDNTRARIESLNEQRIKIDAQIAELNNVRWELISVLDNERKKMASAGSEPSGDQQ